MNLRPPVPQTGALTRLRYAPKRPFCPARSCGSTVKPRPRQPVSFSRPSTLVGSQDGSPGIGAAGERHGGVNALAESQVVNRRGDWGRRAAPAPTRARSPVAPAPPRSCRECRAASAAGRYRSLRPWRRLRAAPRLAGSARCLRRAAALRSAPRRPPRCARAALRTDAHAPRALDVDADAAARRQARSAPGRAHATG